MDWSTLLAVAVMALVALYFLRRKDFVVRARPGHFECWGRMALVEQKALAQFLLHDLSLTGEVQVAGKWIGGRLRLSFRGPLTPGQQQRIRNFLVSSH